jgi:pimeloyl-ACP methyl ester carboxylesterase
MGLHDSGFRRREIANNEVRLSYLENDGDGPVVVALYGLAGAGDEFAATAVVVGRSHRFVLPDLRGHGHSTRRPADLSRDAFAADVAAVIRRVSPGRPVTLAGQSMGGHTAILAAAAFPDLVARLVVLEATVAGGGDPARLGDYFRSWPAPFASAAEAEAFLGQDALSRSWIGHLEPQGDGGLVPPFDADVMQAVMEGVSAPRWEEWTSVTAPTTAVFAAKSMFSPAEQAEFIAARPGTRHVILAGGSHDAHLDATPEWASALSRALEG